MDAHTNLGNVLQESGDLDGAIAEHHAVLRVNPNYAMAHYNLGRVLTEKGDLTGAIAEYRSALQLNPADGDAHNNQGMCQVRRVIWMAQLQNSVPLSASAPIKEKRTSTSAMRLS